MVKMKIFSRFNVPSTYYNSIILIGNFDGVHLGHQKLFKKAREYKRKYKCKIGVVTFNPMPKMFFNKSLKNFKLMNQYQKIHHFEKQNVDFLINQKFSKNFSKIKAELFITNYLNKKLNTKFLFVSNNFKFGNKREGNVKQLINYENFFNYKIIKPKPLKIKKKIISSSLIRKFLESGKLSKANNLLRREWSIEGKVQKGKQLGKKIGFPTANIDIKDYVLACPGVYAVKVLREKSSKFIKGIANLGYRPTFNEKKILLEVHLFNFSGNLYDKYLTVKFLKFIRKEKKFKNVNQLKKQIKTDLLTAKKTI